MHDPYEDQLAAARYRAERDQARQELAKLKDRSRDTTVSAYDLLPKEDREALRWVRGHGGLDTVEKQWELEKDVAGIVGEAIWGTPDRVPDDLDEDKLRAELLSRLMPAGYEWDDRLSGAVEFFESMHDLLYTVDCEDDHDGPEMVQEVMRRLMPEGYEWPRFESGELVRSGDRLIDDNGDWFRAVSFIFTCDWWCIEGYQQTGFGTLSRETSRKLSGMPYSARVKRPAPKVLDADGVVIHVGDTVWDEHGDELVVLAVYGQDVHCRYSEYEDQICDNGTWEPSQLTHRAPVLAADGEPLEAGQTVWVVDTGVEYWVKSGQAITADAVVIIRKTDCDCESEIVKASQLTHERPESWGQLEKDARSIARDIAWNLGNWSPSDFENVGDDVQARVVDLVRRARALAGVSE